jgi:hypothetical protein
MQQAEIRIAEHLDGTWAEWLEGFEITYTDEGQTILTGCVQDQSAFYGLIAKLRDLGVNLVSVKISLPADD